MSTANFTRSAVSGVRAVRSDPERWIFPTRGIAVRIFLTCWLVYAVHFATNTVREIIPAITIAEHFSFRVDEYANLHPDLFEKPGFGWFLDANPGASVIAALPYFLSRPIVDPIVAAVNRSRALSGQKEPPAYNSPWAMGREFYRESWRRGLDVKLGLAALVTQALCMAPLSALGVVAMFYLLRHLFGSDRTSLWLTLLYAFGTPVFYRAGLLNHNMLMGHFALMGFMAMWNPGELFPWTEARRFFLGGLVGGLSLLLDYSGAIMAGGLFLYALVKARSSMPRGALSRTVWWYGLGAAGPVLFLWFYQWKCFGNFILPVEHWMPLPSLKEVHVGYQGFTLPQPVLLRLLLFDYRFGLFVVCPLLLLSVAAPWLNRGVDRRVPGRELSAMFLLSAAMVLFFGGWTSVWLQFTYGLRYLAPVLPFLFVPTALVLMRMPRWMAGLIAIFAVTEAWCMSMFRDVEQGLGVLDPILHVFREGFQLPALTTLSRIDGVFGRAGSVSVSPLPLFAFAGALIFLIWSRRLSPGASSDLLPPVPEYDA